MKANFASALLRKLPFSFALILFLPLSVEGGSESFGAEEVSLDGRSLIPSWMALMPPLALYTSAEARLAEERRTGARSAVFREAQAVDGLFPLIHVDGPCLVILQWINPDRLNLSISDPDLDLSPHLGLARNLSVTLQGDWRMERATAGVQLSPGSDDTTVLTFMVRHGQSFNVGLERAGAAN
jgi:hypothetical protein